MTEEVRRRQGEENKRQKSYEDKKLNRSDNIKRRKNRNGDTADKKTDRYTYDDKKNTVRYSENSKKGLNRQTVHKNKDIKRNTEVERNRSANKNKINREKSEADNGINKRGNKINKKDKTYKKYVRNEKYPELKENSEIKSDNKKKIKDAAVIGAVLLLMLLTYNIFGKSYMDRMERQDFIDTMEPMAVELYEEYGILPSITISQSAVESNWGQSKLSKKGFNLFELKADESWNGGGINLYTKEENNKSGEVEYRKYGSYKEALYDHVEYILEDERFKESALFNSDDYRKQAEVLEKYEKTNKNSDKIIYDDIIIDTIEKYNLDDIDRKYK